MEIPSATQGASNPLAALEGLEALRSNGIRIPKVSIVVTAYNSERFIEETLASVAAQDYHHFECIIVEDQATDGTLAEVQSFLDATDDPRFRLVRQPANSGQLSAQVRGLNESEGEFIVFLDSDDILLPDALSTHLAFHLTCLPVVAFTCMDGAMMDENGVLLAGHHREVKVRMWSWLLPRAAMGQLYPEGPITRTLPPGLSNLITSPFYFWTTQSFMMFRRDALCVVQPGQTELFRSCADFFWVRMVHAFNSSAFIHKTGGSYRVHPNNHFAMRRLVSVDQMSTVEKNLNWPWEQLTLLAGEILRRNYIELSAMFGDFHVMRAFLSLPRRHRKGAISLLARVAGPKRALMVYLMALGSISATRTRLAMRRVIRILWEGD